MKKIAFSIQKGGTGKSTLSGSIAFLSARQGKRTVLVDCDPQGNASSWYLKEAGDYELADVLKGGVTVDKALVKLEDGLSLLPTFGLDGSLKNFGETSLFQEPFIFEDLCNELANDFDLAIFDLSPGMSQLERCVILAMDEVIVPVRPEFFSMDGVQIFRNELDKINRSYRKNVRFRKLVCNGLNLSWSGHVDYYEALKKLDYDLYTIPQDVKLQESQTANVSIFDYSPHSRSIPALQALAEAVI